MKTHIASALLAAPGSHQGAKVPAIAKVHREMREIGLIGPEGGLTRQGVSARERLISEKLDEAFG